MMDRFIFISGVILFLFPFIGVYSVWKMWVAFGLGCCFILYSIYTATQGGSSRSKKRGSRR